jgi:hypothetical protein
MRAAIGCNYLDLMWNKNLRPQSSNLRVRGSNPLSRTIFLERERELTQLLAQMLKFDLVDSSSSMEDLGNLYWSKTWSNAASSIRFVLRKTSFLSDSEHAPKTLPVVQRLGSSRVHANTSICFSVSRKAAVGAIHERARMVRSRRPSSHFPTGLNLSESHSFTAINSRSGNSSRAGPHMKKPLRELQEGQASTTEGRAKPSTRTAQIHEITFLPLVKGSLKHGEVIKHGPHKH